MEAVESLQRMFLSHAYLHTDVGRSRSVIKKIGFQRNLLSISG